MLGFTAKYRGIPGDPRHSILREIALDHYGYITTTQAKAAGVSAVELPKLAARGGLEHVAYGLCGTQGGAAEHVGMAPRHQGLGLVSYTVAPPNVRSLEQRIPEANARTTSSTFNELKKGSSST